jgi:hypothetical protein
MKITRTLVFCATAAFALGAGSFAMAQDTTAQPTEAPAAEAAPVTEAAPAPEAAPAVVEAPAATPSETTSAITGPPPAGKGLVVFFRPSRFTGGAITFTAREGETEIGRLGNDRYFTLAADPGIHEYNIRGGETIRIEVEEGETYYLQLNIAMGMMSGRGVLAPSDKATFEDKSPRLYTPN